MGEAPRAAAGPEPASWRKQCGRCGSAMPCGGVCGAQKRRGEGRSAVQVAGVGPQWPPNTCGERRKASRGEAGGVGGGMLPRARRRGAAHASRSEARPPVPCHRHGATPRSPPFCKTGRPPPPAPPPPPACLPQSRGRPPRPPCRWRRERWRAAVAAPGARRRRRAAACRRLWLEGWEGGGVLLQPVAASAEERPAARPPPSNDPRPLTLLPWGTGGCWRAHSRRILPRLPGRPAGGAGSGTCGLLGRPSLAAALGHAACLPGRVQRRPKDWRHAGGAQLRGTGMRARGQPGATRVAAVAVAAAACAAL